MINVKLIQDLRLVFFFIWLILMLYGFYKYYKTIDFKNISLGRFMLTSCLFFWGGYITAAMIFGIEHLYLLPFMPFGILTLIHWYKLSPSILIAGIIAPLPSLWVIYYMLVKYVKQNLKLRYASIFLWCALFLSGGASFLYVLLWNIF